MGFLETYGKVELAPSGLWQLNQISLNEHSPQIIISFLNITYRNTQRTMLRLG